MKISWVDSFLAFIKLTIDLLVLIILFVLFTFKPSISDVFTQEVFKAIILLTLLWLVVSLSLNIYKSFRFERFISYFKRILVCDLIFSILSLLLIPLFYPEFPMKSKWTFVLLFSFFYLIFSFFFYYGIKLYRQRGYNSKATVLVGEDENVKELIKLLNERKDFGLNPTREFIISDNFQESLNDIENYCRDAKVNMAFVSPVNISDEKLGELLNLFEKLYVSISFIPNNALYIYHSLEINYLDSFPILTYKKYPLDNIFNYIIKRTFDIVFTLITFAVLLWWLIPLLSILVYFSQGRPIFYAQKRNGLNGKEFDCLKFRTMRPDKSNDKKPTERDDPRVTKLGRILRKTSLDELPQFFNVLKGDMSIVGPRPHMVSENESYSEIIKKYSLRHYVKPGITGLAQIRGYRGAIDSEKDMELRVRTDIYYVRNWSFLLDLLIIYKTVRLILVGDENAI